MQRRKVNRVWMLVWLGIPLWWAATGLAAAPLVLTAKDSGKTLTVAVGQRLTVDLKLTKEQQVVAPEFDPFVLTLLGQSLQSSFGTEGTSTRVVYEFVVRQAGRTDLVISVTEATKKGQAQPLLKVKIVAGGGGEMI